MSLTKCPKCGEEYDSMYSEHECQEKSLGFGWGNLWIILSLLGGSIYTILYAILLLFVLQGEAVYVAPFHPVVGFLFFFFLFIWFAALPLSGAIGLLKRKKWGLYLVYTELGLSALLGALGIIGVIIIGKFDESLFLIIFSLGIIYLWFGYFYRRRAWFK